MAKKYDYLLMWQKVIMQRSFWAKSKAVFDFLNSEKPKNRAFCKIYNDFLRFRKVKTVAIEEKSLHLCCKTNLI